MIIANWKIPLHHVKHLSYRCPGTTNLLLWEQIMKPFFQSNCKIKMHKCQSFLPQNLNAPKHLLQYQSSIGTMYISKKKLPCFLVYSDDYQSTTNKSTREISLTLTSECNRHSDNMLLIQHIPIHPSTYLSLL